VSWAVKILFALFFLAAGVLTVEGAFYGFVRRDDRWVYLMVMGLGIGMGVFSMVLYRGVRKLERNRPRGFEVKLKTDEPSVLRKKD
jgi:H+/Cl- antiporter ClcA